uniref:AAA domain-containing protein n=1 Tax=Candidatus Kentrum sp. FM TaxID=2126340 RepID=A0A450RUX1_9GAMM|nr:MAG: AAA domain-containing protein [Candidatus Kentron sp. FM]VFJ43550.1 MAG: AAA domain-containing protein [Candidatus Kentron sp. FM]VFK05594.1 MAG: AAA domain-containing protein [Candidatus Kentron sp. FM]
MKSFVLFNNKGGVGKTTLTYNIAHMVSRLGQRVVVLDYDPQCNISSLFLETEELFEIWDVANSEGQTVSACLDLVRRGKGDVIAPQLQPVADNLWLLPGHLFLSAFEQPLAEEWPKKSSTNNERALDVTLALDQLSNLAAEKVDADFVIIDVGPSLGAINRAALLSCDAVIVPMAPDLFSLQGLDNVGSTLRDWRKEWTEVRTNWMAGRTQARFPHHDFQPIGYLLQQHLARADRPVMGYAKWAALIPARYRKKMLSETPPDKDIDIKNDPNCIATIKHFSSIVPMAQMARKPLFDLKQADGVGGGQTRLVSESRENFRALSKKIIERVGNRETATTKGTERPRTTFDSSIPEIISIPKRRSCYNVQPSTILGTST